MSCHMYQRYIAKINYACFSELMHTHAYIMYSVIKNFARLYLIIYVIIVVGDFECYWEFTIIYYTTIINFLSACINFVIKNTVD